MAVPSVTPHGRSRLDATPGCEQLPCLTKHNFARGPPDADGVQAWTATHKSNWQVRVGQQCAYPLRVATDFDKRKAAKILAARFADSSLPPPLTRGWVTVVSDEEG